MKMHLPAVVFVLLLSMPCSAHGQTFGGIEFPFGERLFADRIFSFSPGSGTFRTESENALGSPENTESVSLGNEGVLVVEFTDNLLVDQNEVENGLDLFVFEVRATGGGITENFALAISSDNENYIELGEFEGERRGVDIGPFINFGDLFRFVRITDLLPANTIGPTAVADINAVGAIGSTAVPEPNMLFWPVLSICYLEPIPERRQL